MSKTNQNISGAVFATVVILLMLAAAVLVYSGMTIQKLYEGQAAFVREKYLESLKSSLQSRVESEISIITYETESESESNWNYLDSIMSAALVRSRQILLSAASLSTEEMYTELGKRFSVDSVPGNTSIRIMSVEGSIILNNEYRTENATELKNITDSHGTAVILNEIEKMNEREELKQISYWKQDRKPGKKFTLARKIPGTRLYIALSTVYKGGDESARDRIIKRVVSRNKASATLTLVNFDGAIEASSNTELINKHAGDIKDAKGRYIYQELLKARQRDEGVFLLYTVAEDSKIQKYAAYAASVDELKWCVSASAPVDSNNEEMIGQLVSIKRNMQARLIWSSVGILSVFGSAVWFVIGRNKRGVNELEVLEENFRLAAEKNMKSEENRFILNELYQTTRYGNMMVDQIHQLRRKLNAVSFEDEQSACYNKNKLLETLEYEGRLFQEYRNPLSLCTLDIDHFESLWQKHGKEKCITLLREFAEFIKKYLRPVDTLVRFENGTFAILLPRTSRLQADMLVKKIRDRMKTAVFLNEESLGFSAGITSFRMQDDAESLIQRSLDAVAESRAEGFGRITVA